MIMPIYLWATDRKRGRGKGEFYLILNLISCFPHLRKVQSSQLPVKATETIRIVLSLASQPHWQASTAILISPSGAIKWRENNEVVC